MSIPPPFDSDRLRSLLDAAAASSSPTGDALTTIREGARARRRSHQILGTIAGVAVVGTAVGLGVALRPDSHGASPQPFASASAAPPSVAPSGSPSPASSTAPVRPPLLPAGFTAIAIDTVGDRWVALGSTSIEVSSDSGQTWVKRAVPSGYSSICHGMSCPHPNVGIRFADESHGLVWSGAQLWTTSDGAGTWQNETDSTSAVTSATKAGSSAYLLLDGGCRESYPQQCSASLGSLTASGYTVKKLTLAPGQQVRSITAAGNEVWVLTSDGSGAPVHVLHSRDFGQTFIDQTTTSNCLSGSLSAYAAPDTSADGPDQPVWLFCATGMSGGPALSRDGAKTFIAVRSLDGLSNSSPLAATGPSSAIIGTENGIFMTINQGGDWKRFEQPPNYLAREFVVSEDKVFAFMDLNNGEASHEELWVSADHGQSWTTL